MRIAEKKDKVKVISILCKSFRDNQSVNYLVKQDKYKRKRAVGLMDYSYESCKLNGQVYLSDDENACALVQYMDLKPPLFKAALLDIKLIISTIGIGNIFKALKRQSTIKGYYPEGSKLYLWYIGVDPAKQGVGIGSRLLNEVMEKEGEKFETICLETSTPLNVPWYQNHGFELYGQTDDFGFPFYFFKRSRTA
ncbi:GNAT family N-acetyltransferase [Echinicola salinicaeni]|uniref:GNAT family N-acetyltransferase n=1 Tax=Echinicola salinicaeni TaxID=2762757 RepID=UPI0016442514|nr:GNAT family N-acetyltransferase [Echinicola salinicaeni]